MSDLMLDTPQQYAKRLAGYIASPTKIESLTRLEFGRAPPLHVIARMRLRVEQEAKAFKNGGWHGDKGTADGRDFTVPTFVPKERARDYIHVKPAEAIAIKPEPSGENPFEGLFKTGARLIASVARDLELTPAEITGHRRWGYLVDARVVIAALLKRWGRHSFPQIGRMLNRDHSTIIHNCGNLAIACKRNPQAAATYARHLALLEEAERQLAQQDNAVESEAA